MDIHENARTTPHGRSSMVRRLAEGWTAAAAAAGFGSIRRPVRDWRDRFAAEGATSLADGSSRPRHSPTRLSAVAEAEIEELRRQRLSGPAITAGLAGRDRPSAGPAPAWARPAHPARAAATGDPPSA
jgi:leucine-zipper of insertion element IS481